MDIPDWHRETPDEEVAVDGPEQKRDLERSSRAGSPLSRYTPRSLVRQVRLRDEGRCQVLRGLNGRRSQLHQHAVLPARRQAPDAERAHPL